MYGRALLRRPRLDELEHGGHSSEERLTARLTQGCPRTLPGAAQVPGEGTDRGLCPWLGAA